MIRVELNTHIAFIAFDRPDKRNALTPDMLASLQTAIRQVSSHDFQRAHARVILLHGLGPAFCAGFDLSLCKDHPDGSVMRALLTGLSESIAALRDQPLPVVIAAHGAAIAGGCALLGAADFIVTDDNAKLGYPVVKMGVSPAVSAPFYRLLAGDGPTRERMLDTKLMTGKEAHARGIVSDLVAAPDEVLPRSTAIAADLATKPPAALAATRALLREIAPADPWPALAASLSLTGGPEEQRLLPRAWMPNASMPSSPSTP